MHMIRMEVILLTIYISIEKRFIYNIHIVLLIGLIVPITKCRSLHQSVYWLPDPHYVNSAIDSLYSIFSYKILRINLFSVTCLNCRPWVFQWQILPEEVNHSTSLNSTRAMLYLYSSFLTSHLHLKCILEKTSVLTAFS